MAKRRSVQPEQAGPAVQGDAVNRRVVFCKQYHAANVAGAPGKVRAKNDVKSLCPSWAATPAIQQALIDEAIEEPGGGTDLYGRPKILWNALERKIFIARSCNMREPMYNCYPVNPPCGKLFSELQRRARRTVEDLGLPVGGR
jgi:hypothetical protein